MDPGQMWSWGDIPKQLQSFEDFSILFRCGGGCLPPHLTWSPITFGSNGTFAPNAFGKSSVGNRSPIARSAQSKEDGPTSCSASAAAHRPARVSRQRTAGGPVSKTLGSVLAGGVVGAHTARTAAQSCVELLSLSRRTHPRLEDHRSADPGGGRQLTTVQAKETDRKIFFAKKCNA